VTFEEADMCSNVANQCDVSIASFEALANLLLNMPLVDVDKEDESNAVCPCGFMEATHLYFRLLQSQSDSPNTSHS
jgi:hypothetical protein